MKDNFLLKINSILLSTAVYRIETDPEAAANAELSRLSNKKYEHKP
jgi:hypothetical protein